jgi:hypothetical protein
MSQNPKKVEKKSNFLVFCCEKAQIPCKNAENQDRSRINPFTHQRIRPSTRGKLRLTEILPEFV